ncbi:L-threonine ammonia-lyase [Rhodovastum atsumiense]|uniref:L-threonine dehydratase catabolic TdcB n=1 Tax=Rhodovastum atsumiense TaxID=504468 RepID=A0A5M6INQ8_9PROT|nr:threonine ammonia-lyase [Rhodovastum atsumiense]KAA5609539.1 threonine ammonia-lyase [Rhodovastum atsumiense]CAH2604932.1 L-threonine ammonia-lyase [Rhodovastum atsumiense]
MITLADVRAAAERIAGRVLHTPSVPCDVISRACGAEVTLKLDNLQATGAFKERGAANRLALLTETERRAGVIAMSAGNHAQAVARHAQLLGITAVIVMPKHTPLTKVSRTAAWGARVVLHGDTLAEAAAHAQALSEQEGLVFIHPYDDAGVMAGQGTMALEILADSPEIDTLVVPIGGGGLIAGCAVAACGLRPGIEVIGVEVAAYAAMAQRLAGQPVSVGGTTIAEGIAVRDIGLGPLSVIRAHVADVVVVPERAVEEAIALLGEGAKIVAEGAGASGIAALLAFPDRFKGRRVGVPITGGNIDPRIFANVLLRNLLRDGRLVRLVLEIPDRPGVLADISGRIGGAGGNIIDVSHHRLFASPSVQAAQLEVMFETRDAEHSAEIVHALEQIYTLRRV